MQDLELLLRSRHAIIFVETEEKDRVQSLLAHVADRMRIPYYVWTRTKGLQFQLESAIGRIKASGRYSEEAEAPLSELQTPASLTLTPTTALNEVERLNRTALFNFQGLGSDLEDRVVAAKLADAAKQFMSHEGGIVISGKVPAELPNAIKAMTTVLELPSPSSEEYFLLIKRLYRDLSQRSPIELRMSKDDMARLVKSLQGLTLTEAEKVLTKAMVEDQQLGPDDIKRVIESKRDIIEREGLLEYYPSEENLETIAGLKGLKQWLKKRRNIIAQPEKAAEFGLEFPKGILLLGIQGSGKSLCAKAVAGDWGLPLLKMDPAGLYNKYIGETEKNFRRATQVAEKMAPVVLWIDEIEKAFASSGDIDGGVSQRVLGTFLSWLQERKGDVFVVATANDVSKLPPELIRKGRFDELFFVDLPDENNRLEILALHLTKRRRSPEQFDLKNLASLTEGFSGAELEQVIVAGLYTAFAESTDLSTDILLNEIRQTVPLSQTMAEKLEALRLWASGRAVLAN